MVQKVRAADPMHIGVRLGKLCIEKNVPVSEVAEAMNVSRLTVYKWFIGQFYPKPEKMKELEELLVKYGLR